MSEFNYQGSVILRNDKGLQEVYSSQNYGTFYSIYMKFDLTTDPNDSNIVYMDNIEFSIVNYKGILNLGIVRVEPEFMLEENFLDFKVDVRALENTRKYFLEDENKVPVKLKIDLQKIRKGIRIIRTLLKMSTAHYDPLKNPNSEDNLVFDDEFYYRDGLEFNDSENERAIRGGMKGFGGGISGKRCYTVTLKVIK